MKYVVLFSWKDNNCYYYWYDCMIGEGMNVDGHPFKFVTMFENGDYQCFLKSEDTVKELIIELLKLVIGKNYSSSKDYDTKIIFKGVNQPPEINKYSLIKKRQLHSVFIETTIGKRFYYSLQEYSTF